GRMRTRELHAHNRHVRQFRDRLPRSVTRDDREAWFVSERPRHRATPRALLVTQQHVKMVAVQDTAYETRLAGADCDVRFDRAFIERCESFAVEEHHPTKLCATS